MVIVIHTPEPDEKVVSIRNAICNKGKLDAGEESISIDLINCISDTRWIERNL